MNFYFVKRCEPSAASKFVNTYIRELIIGMIMSDFLFVKRCEPSAASKIMIIGKFIWSNCI